MLLLALTAYGINPLGAHGASFGARFAADDDPVDTTEIHRTNILKKRFDRQEANPRIDLP